jgi:cobalt/nickel transport system permease protein
MYEQFLEDIAQKNALREVNPYSKLITGLGAIILCLASTSFVAPLFITLVLTGSVILLARIDVRTYAGLFITPFVFAGMSVVVIILISGGGEVFWSWHPLSWLFLSITRDSINEGVFVFCRVIGGTSAVCFLALTTPMTELFVILRQCRAPAVLIDLAMIIYRTIFILLDQLIQIYHAQTMRLGYTTFRETIRSLATLCGAVFLASWDAGEDLIRAMDARCYTGKFAMLGKSRPVEVYSLLLVVAFLLASLTVVILSRSVTVV